jgi:hypothetical protein
MAELFEVTGVDALARRLEQLPPQVVFLAGIALQQEADAITQVAQSLAPVETGALRDSLHAEDVVIDGMRVSTGVRGGGTGTGGRRPEEYILRQEFDITLRHPRGGQAFFLTQATFAAVQGMGERLAEAIRIAL